MDGALAYPRSNGEPVFDGALAEPRIRNGRRPPQGRPVSLGRLQAAADPEIDAGRPAEVPAEASEYYYQWVEAFSRLAVETGLLQESEIAAREHEFQTGIRQEVF